MSGIVNDHRVVVVRTVTSHALFYPIHQDAVGVCSCHALTHRPLGKDVGGAVSLILLFKVGLVLVLPVGVLHLVAVSL